MAHAALLRQDDFVFAPETGPYSPKMIRETDFLKWEAYLRNFHTSSYNLEELTEMCMLGRKVHNAASAYNDSAAKDIEIFIP